MHYSGFLPVTEEQQVQLNPATIQYCYPQTSDEQNQYYNQQISNQPNYSMVPQPEPFEPQEPCTDDYSCKCDNCQNKYGSLPILLQGIEQKNFSQINEPEASTSGQCHTPKRILTCEYCKKTFTHKGDFKKHLRKHTKEKPFSCKFCSKSFGNTSNLLRHQKLHTGEKPFACEYCSKKFSRKDKLDCHRRSRTCQEAGTSTSNN
ncbi:gastrula zinc finger protein XlCGF49.1-like [Diorhabda sublineata]|uniref:gastrula zinc finger protein XlCGF49.1-like n=1 Tax=Diorhabda sublineata TaxID=1163346 RepID=UPI0024E06CE7|nr:gastrula zinc finger protein XlCGF49.1-like [Diorhabda sublineata]